MTKTKLLLLTTLGLALSLSGCSQETPDPVTSETYEACCGAEPVEYTFGDARMYVPNVFTPNGDGVNDLFYPFVNDSVLAIDVFLIYTPVGDTLMFDRPGFDYNNLGSYAWNGRRYDGSQHKGPFKYFVSFILKDGLHEVEGRACSIVCGPEAAVFQTKEGCFYPVQSSAGGILNPTAPNFESDCFK